ncbi:ABC transporter permease [Edaphobacter dinghuensis]|nr:ABC transporter permease [Edaphobacter dinghuensis]
MLRRLLNLGRQEKIDAEIQAELESHLQMRTDDNLAAGMSPEQARREARLRFGNPIALKERAVASDAALELSGLWRDLLHAVRQLRRSPAFTATSIITLALGIGATTAIFTLVQQVMLQSLPVANPQELWRVGDKMHCCTWGGYTQDGDFTLFSWDLYRSFRTHTPGFEELAAFQASDQGLGVRPPGGAQQTEPRSGQFVSGNFFQTFGIGAWIGRVMTDSDDQENAPPVAVMSYQVWKEKYGSDPSVVGAVYQIDGHPFTVIGVAPPGFYGASLKGWDMPDFWLPLASEPLINGTTSLLKTPGQSWLNLIGRIQPGSNPRTIEAQLRLELRQWQASHLADMTPPEKESWQQQTLNLTPGGSGVSELRAQYKDGLKLLMAAAGCVLLVVCANLANLLLARGLRNRQQTAVRVALGASRRRLIRKALVESIALSLMGGLLGIGVAYAGTNLIVHLAFPVKNASSPIQVAPSVPMLFFALAVATATGILFGIGPAWMTSHAEPVEALRGANRSVGGRSRIQQTLVIAQASMSLVLLSIAALLGQSLRNLKHQNFGFDMNGRYVAWINPKLGGYKPEQLDPLFERIQDRLKAIPGVKAVSTALYAPMSGEAWNAGIRVAGKPEPGPHDDNGASWVRVTPGFFETLGNPILRGRPITDDDTAATLHVAVINEAFAKKFFKGEDPIGRHFGSRKMKYAGIYTVVGIAADMRYVTWGLKEPNRPMFYVPETQTVQYDEADEMANEIATHYLTNVILWAPGHQVGLEEQVREALHEIDPDLVLSSVDSYPYLLKSVFAQQNMISTLVEMFGALGLVLAAVGLYGVTAYSVEQRTGEIGVRMALGADRGKVMQMVLRGAFLQVSIGLAIGVPASIGVGWVVASQLFEVRPWDPVALVLSTTLLLLAALTAGAIPAQRAASIDPTQALRME